MKQILKNSMGSWAKFWPCSCSYSWSNSYAKSNFSSGLYSSSRSNSWLSSEGLNSSFNAWSESRFWSRFGTWR